MPKQFYNMNFLVSAKAYRDGEKSTEIEPLYKSGPLMGLYYRGSVTSKMPQSEWKHGSEDLNYLLNRKALYLKDIISEQNPAETANWSEGRKVMFRNFPVHKPKLECEFYGGAKDTIVFKSNEELDQFMSTLNDRLEGALAHFG
jgi:hypothetical protein